MIVLVQLTGVAIDFAMRAQADRMPSLLPSVVGGQEARRRALALHSTRRMGPCSESCLERQAHRGKGYKVKVRRPVKRMTVQLDCRID